MEYALPVQEELSALQTDGVPVGLTFTGWRFAHDFLRTPVSNPFQLGLSIHCTCVKLSKTGDDCYVKMIYIF